MDVKRYINRLNIAMAVLFAAMFFYGDAVLFTLVYFALFLFVSFRAIQSTGRKRTRFLLIVTYFVVMVIQVAYYLQVVYGFDFWMEHPFRKLTAVAALLLPMIISRYVAVNKYTELYLPSLQEAATISFSQAREFAGAIAKTMGTLKKTKGSMSAGNFKAILGDLPQHDSFSYINSGSLTEEYFRAAEASMEDLNLYIIVSDTGTPASEMLSAFTQNQFNHASLSFDAGLATIVSYNGGQRVYPPGLNREMLDLFNNKPDASILVYRLPVTYEQKRAAIDKIAQINREGSAYNMLGLLIGQSYKPNIMYCSQFVYNLLKSIGASYFEAAGVIKPTDLIEKDYYRKLEFAERIMLNAESGRIDSAPAPGDGDGNDIDKDKDEDEEDGGSGNLA